MGPYHCFLPALVVPQGLGIAISSAALLWDLGNFSLLQHLQHSHGTLGMPPSFCSTTTGPTQCLPPATPAAKAWDFGCAISLLQHSHGNLATSPAAQLQYLGSTSSLLQHIQHSYGTSTMPPPFCSTITGPQLCFLSSAAEPQDLSNVLSLSQQHHETRPTTLLTPSPSIATCP